MQIPSFQRQNWKQELRNILTELKIATKLNLKLECHYYNITIPFSILINRVSLRIIHMLLQLREYDSCTFWLESIKSKSTLDAYTIHLSLFCKFHNTNPDQLI
ncbi:MAG TPA: hypothetical protein VEL70_01760, partial [Candidatus Acidoferrum sp.]|nr:hypothetical protein [Candidatus Acidoferrum sp.]